MTAWWAAGAGAVLLCGCWYDIPSLLESGAGGGSASSGTAGGNGGDITSTGGSGNQGGGGMMQPTCAAGLECVPALPTDWQAFARANSAAFPDVTGALCPDSGAPDTYFDTPTNAAAVCDACSCGAPTGQICDYPTFNFYNNSTQCNGGQGVGSWDYQDGICGAINTTFTNGNASAAMVDTSDLVAAGSCAASGGAATLPAPWTNQVAVCTLAVAAGECGVGNVCVPEGSAGYTGPTCVVRDGDHPCPAAFPNLMNGATAYAGETDTRACSSCACAAPAGTACSNGSYTVMDNNSCNGTSVTYSDTSCHDVSGLFNDSTGSAVTVQGVPSGGSCATSGGMPVGAVMPNAPVTICCL
jgi:hypothetical protein